MTAQQKGDRAIQIAAGLEIVGLLVEIFTLQWKHPTSFVLFAGLGGFLMFVGLVIYLRVAFLKASVQ